MFKPEVGKKFKLVTTLEGKAPDGEVKWGLTWVEDLPALKSKAGESHLDERAATIETCEEWQGLKKQISGATTIDFEAESTAQHSAWQDRGAKEIFACIRAEYRFIANEGYKKVKSRIGPNGMDHLFVQSGQPTVICESKTISDLSIVTRHAKRSPPDSFLQVLGEGRRVGKERGKVVFATQMTKAWCNDCLTELQDRSTGASQAAARQTLYDIQDGNYPKRVVNIYGGLNWSPEGAYAALVAEAKRQWNALSEEQKKEVSKKWKKSQQVDPAAPYIQSLAPKTGEAGLLYIHKRWMKADPLSGRFYLLPGKYGVVSRAAWLNGAKPQPQDVDFADEMFKKGEFFEIETLPEDLQAEFEKLVKKRKK
jgi:hypothetical protein